jgi:hypothetical protein
MVGGAHPTPKPRGNLNQWWAVPTTDFQTACEKKSKNARGLIQVWVSAAVLNPKTTGQRNERCGLATPGSLGVFPVLLSKVVLMHGYELAARLEKPHLRHVATALPQATPTRAPAVAGAA